MGVAAIAALLAVTAACGSAGDTVGGTKSDTAGDGSGDSGDTGMTVQSLHIEVTVDVTGALTLKGRSSAPMPTNNGVDYTSCGQYAGGEKDDNGRQYYVLPQMLIDSIDGKTVFVGAMIKDYKGAGKYEKNTLTDTGSPPGIGFAGTLYLTRSSTTSTVTTDGKGGGRWDFTDLSTKESDGPAVTGSVTWTCTQ